MTVAVASTGTADVVASPTSPYAPLPIPAAYAVRPGPAFALDYQREATYWVVRDVETGIFGHADTLSDALRDFNDAARGHLELLERQEALSPELGHQLAYLRARLTD